MTAKLWLEDAPQAQRQAKTDRLFLGRLVEEAARDQRFDESEIAAAHAVLIRWADFEKGGRLAKKKEIQLQGDFLAEVFGQALGYVRAVENEAVWHQEQHFAIGNQTPDAVLGNFRQGETPQPLAVIELKGPEVHLDRDRSNGRTAVDQCWDYLVNLPTACRWGIVSNLVSFRLYERDSTKRAYEHFALQRLRDPAEFRRFYALLRRKGLIEPTAGAPPRAVSLLQKTKNRQREVSDKLYEVYSQRRIELLQYLHHKQGHPLDLAVEMAQRLIDRIMFIAFCEDRNLLPAATIEKAYTVAGFSAVTNPRWQSFKSLFRFVDRGNLSAGIPGYNGGLFAPHPVDDLELPDEHTVFFKTIAEYDFADEVNLDVLGHLLERSITELEKLKESGLFGGSPERAERYAQMPQSARRKQLGVYYTPQELTGRIVQYTVDELILERYADLAAEHGIDRADALRSVFPEDEAFWRGAIEVLRDLRVVDPACGSGAFLFQAYDVLEARYLEAINHLGKHNAAEAAELSPQVAQWILTENLFGVDLLPEAVEIAQLALWIRSAAPGQTLASLSENIVHGNSLVDDPEVDPAAFDWSARFAAVFERSGYQASGGGFDCVIGNPPWERIKLQEREFFALPAPEIATATNAAARRRLVEALKFADAELFARYEQAKQRSDGLLTHCRKSGAYPLCGRGDTNLYAVFAELAGKVVAPRGRVGILVPSGIASDSTTKEFFASVAESNRLIRLFDFENKKVFFPEVHASFKFCILCYGGDQTAVEAAEFVFFAHSVDETDEPARRIALTGDDIKLLNPNTRTCPIFRTRRDAEITKAIYRRVPILIDKNRSGPTGNAWGISFQRMFDQTNDAELFREAKELKDTGLALEGNRWVGKGETYLPVYEAKMLQAFDHRAADVFNESNNWVRQGQTEDRTQVDYQNPERLAMPRYWIPSEQLLPNGVADGAALLCFKDVTSPTNRRTMIAAYAPTVGVVNSAPIVRTNTSPVLTTCLLGNLNCYAYDFIVRQKISNLHLNFFIVEQIPTLPPDAYAKPARWTDGATLEAWISQRVLKLTCTAEDMLPLADACGFTSGSFQREYGGRLNKWDDAERVELMAELDAAYFHLYGIDRDDAEYILSTFKGVHSPSGLTPGGDSIADNILRVYDGLGTA